jgi:hypothetical protein
MNNMLIRTSDNQDEPETLKKIDNFLYLEKGWHYGKGVSPSKETIAIAKKIAEQALSYIFDTDAFPGIEGEIMVTVYHKEHYLEFTIESDGEITFVHEVNDEELVYKEGLKLQEAKIKLDDFCEKIWNISELSTESIMIPKRSDSKVWPLKILQMVESQLFHVRASISREEVFASI